MATKKTSKRALPNVPGAAMVQALGDAVFGKGNAVVEATYPVTFAGQPVTVNLSVREVVAAYKAHTSLGSPYMPKAPQQRPEQMRACIETVALVNGGHALDVVEAILAARHGAAPPGDAVANVLAMTLRTLRSAETATLRAELSSRGLGPITTTALHEKLTGIGATRDAHGFWRMPDADAIAAAILRLFAVAPDTGIAEDEVTRHLLALDLTSDVDDVSDRLLAMVTATTLAIVRRGKPDTRKRGPIMYARGPAFPATGGAS